MNKHGEPHTAEAGSGSFDSEESKPHEGVTEEEREAERESIARALFGLRYDHRGYPDLGREMTRHDAIEFQKHMRELGIGHLSPELKARFDREYRLLSADEQRREWDPLIEAAAIEHFTDDDRAKYDRFQKRFKNKFADNWCMKVAAWLERLVDDDQDERRDAVLRSLFSDTFRNRIRIMASRLYHSLGQKDKRSPRDIGEINKFLDEVFVQLYPEIKNRSAQFARKRLEDILKRDTSHRPTPS